MPEIAPLVTNTSLAVDGSAETGKKFDPFVPPYSPNLHVGDLQDADGQEYVVLVSWPSESRNLNVIKCAAASSINIQSFPDTFFS
jgi:hypothetical protein